MEKVLVYKPDCIKEFINTEELTLDFYYKNLECDCIDIPYISEELRKRKIDIILDDEGKLKDREPVAIIINNGKILDVLVGNIMFCSVNDDGETVGLDEKQIEYINSLPSSIVLKDDKTYMVLEIEY